MKYVRIIIVILFICVCGAFGWTRYLNTKKDVTPPVITSEIEELHMDATLDSTALRQGLTATDDRDGDLTDEVLVGKISRFSEKGVCTVEYVVFDHSNNVTTFKRKVYFDNYESPKLTLSQPLMYSMNGTVTIFDRLSANDMLDGNINNKLKIVSDNVDVLLEGTYELEVEATNSCGDTTHITLPVNIVHDDADAPKIYLDTYLVYVKKGEPFDPKAHITEVVDKNQKAIGKEQVVITSYADLSVPGCYQYKFEVTDEKGVQGSTYLVVIVEE